MMRQQSMLRDAMLLVAAGALGWWAHGANTAVQAQHSSSSSAHEKDSFGFQVSGVGRDSTLTVYNPDNRTLYVYPSGVGNAHINCAYSIRVERPGAPLERQNCAIGSAF